MTLHPYTYTFDSLRLDKMQVHKSGDTREKLCRASVRFHGPETLS